MNFVADTHSLLWWFTDSQKTSLKASGEYAKPIKLKPTFIKEDYAGRYRIDNTSIVLSLKYQPVDFRVR
jgi:hypothetical protein